MHRVIRLSRWLFSFLLLTACAVGPDYIRPSVETPEQYKEGARWKKAQPQDQVERGKWWEAFGDPKLGELEEQVDVSNQTVKAVEAQYRQAQALVQQARSAFFPVITAGASESRGKSSAHKTTNNYLASLDASWEPDLWGRVRRSVEASEATAESNAANVESVRLLMQAELAIDYLQLRVVDEETRLLGRTVAAYEKSVALTQNQYNVGVAARADVVQAQTQLESTRAQAIDLGVARAQFEHAIAILIGKPPASFALDVVDTVPTVPDIPIGLPSELLERRPDIAAAERAAAAANAQIGVAESAFFPAVTLSATGGYASAGFASWLTGPSRIWAIGPAIAETVFDAGLRRAQTEQAIAAYDQSVANYRQTVLAGFQEVEDNLAALRILAQEAETQHTAVALSQESTKLTLNQYKAGTVSFLNVVTAQTAELTDERTELAIIGRRLTAAVTLIKALGGNWPTPSEAGPSPTFAEDLDALCSIDHLANRLSCLTSASTQIPELLQPPCPDQENLSKI